MEEVGKRMETWAELRSYKPGQLTNDSDFILRRVGFL